jgi:hypothetical protein
VEEVAICAFELVWFRKHAYADRNPVLDRERPHDSAADTERNAVPTTWPLLLLMSQEKSQISESSQIGYREVLPEYGVTLRTKAVMDSVADSLAVVFLWRREFRLGRPKWMRVPGVDYVSAQNRLGYERYP